MELVINETVPETAISIIDERKLSHANHILRTYGYVVIGILLTLVNFPVFIIVARHRKLRNSYIVIAVASLNSGFLGISLISIGIKRIIATFDGEGPIEHLNCVLSAPLLFLTAEFMSGWNLLMNSLERFFVVAFPLYYYTKSTYIGYSLITAQYVITIIAIFSAVIACLLEPPRYISNFCLLSSTYSHNYKILSFLSSFAAVLSIIVMIVVVIILKRKFGKQFLSNKSHSHSLLRFLNNQKRYTNTAIISCCLTFFLVVVTSGVEHNFKRDPRVSWQTVVIVCIYLRLLNSFNIVLLFLYRQKDFRHLVIHYRKYLVGRRKMKVAASELGGFVK